MIQNFNVTQLYVDEKDYKLILGFSLDIDEDTVDGTSVFVTEVGSDKQTIIHADKKVDGKNLTIEMPEMKVNTDYEITITPDIKSVTDMPLATKFRRRLSIESSVDSTVAVLSPSDFEDVESILKILLKETPGKSGTLFGNYEVQIASEPGFYDILHDMEVAERSSLAMAELKPSRQYFIRARAVDGENYGNWSKKVAFTFSKRDESDKDKDDDPVFISPLRIVATPDAGKTPESFIIVFDHEIDPASVDTNKILLLRKQV